MAIEVGATAPDFTLYDSAKQLHTLSQYRGQKVVLAFFPGAFTGACDKEVCALRDSMARYNEMNALVLGISVDGPFALKEFSTKYDLNFPLLADFERKVIAEYDVVFHGLGGVTGYNTANRAVFILDGEGVVRYMWEATPSPGIEPNYEEVLAAVEALGE